MSEIRKNIATNEWAIIATERAKRPDEIIEKETNKEPVPVYKENCPFCPGNENKTPPEILRIGDKDKWQVRVFSNKFAALMGDHPPTHVNDGIIQRMDGIGAHEVIVETPLHNAGVHMMTEKEIENFLDVYKQRYIDLEKRSYIKQIIIFKNSGSSAGTSLEHPHSQLIALPLTPSHILDRVEEAYTYYKNLGECVFCKMLNEELFRKERIIIESEHFVTFVPYAAYSPFHTWILPKKHNASFRKIDDNQIKDLAKVLKTYLTKLHKGLNDPSYNLMIRSIPCGHDEVDHFHWYIAIVVRLTSTAGFEMGSGMFINVSLPESDAAYLRGI